MRKFRILWRDSAGIGRFDDIDAEDRDCAVWNICKDICSDHIELVAVIEL